MNSVLHRAELLLAARLMAGLAWSAWCCVRRCRAHNATKIKLIKTIEQITDVLIVYLDCDSYLQCKKIYFHFVALLMFYLLYLYKFILSSGFYLTTLN